LPTVIAAPGAIVTSPAPGLEEVSSIDLVAKFDALRSPIPPVRNRLLLVARSLLNRLSDDARKVLTLTWLEPPKMMPLRLIR
jgi:hypothetical protein